jgi:uncharacterized protein (DUF427 family)
MSVRAVWNGIVLAESDETKVVEGNHYFPPESINREYVRQSQYHTVCPWKGQASYYDVEVDGQTNRNAAWYYPTPSDAARQIRDHVAFWNGVKVQRVNDQGEPEPGAVKSLINSPFGK